MNVLVTGATGFVGGAVCRRLFADGHRVFGTVRGNRSAPPDAIPLPIPDLDKLPPRALEDIEGVVHLAARVHQLNDRARDPRAAFRAVNTEATLALAATAARRGVERFVFMSSIRVNRQGLEIPLSEQDEAAPTDAYGWSKWEAEQGLRSVAARTGLKVTVLRPPLVYGPGVRGNFRVLLKAVEERWPLPFAAVDNRRSLIHVANLADAVAVALGTPSAGFDTYLISDGEDISTADLVRRLSAAMGRAPRLWRVAPATLAALGRLTGQSATIDRVIGSLRVDSSLIRRRLGWSPAVSLSAGLAEVAQWYLEVAREQRTGAAG